MIIDIGLRYCRSCCNASRMYLVKTGIPGSKSVKLFVCRWCDRA